ncbi:trypsin-like peptidase domain-containing protein [Tenacibaculum xiamenense]|uniref:trypsin-like peptidase domain-containing protein n=1 Tax=Tenacibaculum xiamenense TaxID=1261553 RepID=UPI003894F231
MKNHFFKVVIMAMVFLCATTTSAQKIFKIGDEFDSDIKVTKTYQRFKRANSNKSGTELVYQKEFYSKNSSYIKLYFKNFDLAPGDYVEITGSNSKETIIYGGKGKIVDDQMTMISDFWSKVLFDDKVVLKLYSSGAAERYKGFEIGKVAYGYSEEKIEATLAGQTRSICGSDNKERIACYQGTTMFDKGKAVCRLLIGGSSLCTGWLLGSEGHLMTNNHCIGTASRAQNTDYIFNYQHQGCTGSTLAQQDVVAQSATFIKTNSTLDYTLVKLPTNPTNTYGYLSLSSAVPAAGDRIYIPQHPGGRRKEISVKTDTDATAGGFSRVYQSSSGSGQQVRYYADTEGGSSGSPVLDYNSNLVIAIHNTGGCPNGSYGRCDNLISAIGNDMPANGVDNSGGGGGGGGGDPKCESTVSSFPYSQSFENTLGSWKQSTSDDFNWATRSGSTPSRNTGPSSANAGSYYLYVESSSPNYPSKSAIVTSPCFDLSQVTSASFTFDYHMYGASGMGNLKLEASTDKGATWTSVWQKSGNQGNSWSSASVNLNSYAGSQVKLRFNGTTGSTWQGDMAIDKLGLSTNGSGGGGGNSTVTLEIVLDNYPGETTWEIKNSAGSIVSSGGTYSNADKPKVTKTITLSNGCYSLTFKDSYGDGICCAYGSGSYTLSSSTGAVLASGGQFASSETKNFCVGESANESFVEKFVPTTQVIDDLMIYPNPVQGALSLKIPERELNGTYKIVNVTGAVIQTGKLSRDISVNQMQEGVYILEVKTDKSTYSKTFVKVKGK